MSPAATFSLFPTIETYPKVDPRQPFLARTNSRSRMHQERSVSASTLSSTLGADEVSVAARQESRERRIVAIPAPTGNIVDRAIPESAEQDDVSSLHSFSSSPPRGRPRLSKVHSVPSTSRSSMTLVPSECPSRTTTIRRNASNDDASSIMTSTSTLLGNAEASSKPKGRPAPIRSIFPEYNEDISLREQLYLPTQISPRNLPWEQVTRQPYSPDFNYTPESEAESSNVPAQDMDNSMDDFAYTPEYELPKLWDLMEGAPMDGSVPQTFKLKMHRRGPPTKAELKLRNSKRRGAKCENLLSFGPSHARAFMTVTTDTEDVEADQDGRPRTRIGLTRRDPTFLYHPGTQLQDITVPVTDFLVSSKATSSAEKTLAQEEQRMTTITPHSAIVSALSSAAASPEGAHLANVDPMANTKASARLAESAIAKARAQYGSQLVYTTATGGSHTGRWSYALRSQQLGVMPIEIDGDVRLDNTSVESSSSSTAPAVRAGTIRLMTPPSPSAFKRSFSPSSSTTSLFSSSNYSRGGGSSARELASLSLSSSTLTIHVGMLVQLSSVNNMPLASAIDLAVSTLISTLVVESYSPRISSLLSFLPPPGPAAAPAKKGAFARKLRKSKSASNDVSDEGKLEHGVGTAFGAVAFMLSVAVDGLAGVIENVERKRQLSASAAASNASASSAMPQFMYTGAAAQHESRTGGLFASLKA